MESGPVPSTNSVYSASGGGQQPSQRPGKGHSRMAQVIQRRFPRPTFHAAPVQHGEPPLSPADGGPPFGSRRHSDHRRISAVDHTEVLNPSWPPLPKLAQRRCARVPPPVGPRRHALQAAVPTSLLLIPLSANIQAGSSPPDFRVSSCRQPRDSPTTGTGGVPSSMTLDRRRSAVLHLSSAKRFWKAEWHDGTNPGRLDRCESGRGPLSG
jgi:hypothetical protein